MEQVDQGGHPTAIVEVNTSLARVPVALLRLVGVVIGEQRAMRIATRVALRLTRWRVRGQRRWLWMGPEEHRGEARLSWWTRTWTMAIMVVLPTAVAAALCISAMTWLLR